MKRLLLIGLLALGCTAPAASPGPTGGIDVPSTSTPSGEVGTPLEEECGLPEGCGPTVPPTDTQ